MSVRVNGFKELIDKLDRMADFEEKNGKKALEMAGNHVRDVEETVARREHMKWSEHIGYKELKRYPVRINRRGNKYVNIGIRARVTKSQQRKDDKNQKMGKQRATYWDRVKGLWFNHYGFFHNRTGRYITGSHWMDNAYDESIEGAYKILKKQLLDRLEF